LAQFLFWSRVSTPQNTIVFLWGEMRARLDFVADPALFAGNQNPIFEMASFINLSQRMTMEPVQFPINGILDLHTFLPRDVPDLLDDYFEACIAKGVFSVRVIHGKGQGILRARVLKHLKRHPLVRTIKAAPPEAGGWGATLVELSPNDP
jgi:hypothetical protein